MGSQCAAAWAGGAGGPVLSLSVTWPLPLEHGLGAAGTGALRSLQGGGH